MDFVFGSNNEDAKKQKNKSKQLKTQIFIKQQPKKEKQLTPLQKFKLQAKKKNQQQLKNSQFDELQSNEFFAENSVKQFSSIDPTISLNKILQGQLSMSEKNLKFLQKKLIADRLGDMQNLVYNAQSSQQPSKYLKGVYQNIWPDNQFIKSNVSETVNNAVKSVQKQIQEPKGSKKLSVQKRRIPKNKQDLKQLQKVDKYRLIKIKEGQVKNKVGDLRNQLQKQYFINKDKLKFDTSNIVEKNYYSMEHPQTMKAQNLIHEIHEKRIAQHRKFKQYLHKKQSEKQRIHQLQQQFQQKMKQQRKEKLKQFYEQKHHQRQEHKQQLRKKQQDFSKWIKMYQRQKPLQQKLQNQMVMKFIIPQIQDRHKKLMKIKAEHKPIDMEQINEHDHRYMDYKRDQMIRQKAQFQMKIQNDQINQEQLSRYYKGRYRYMALQSMYQQKNITDGKDVQRSKKQRQLAYSDQVKYYHKPMIKRRSDQMEDTRSLIRRVRNHNGTVSVNQNRENKTIDVEDYSDKINSQREHHTLDSYAEGIKNLNYVKSHIRQKLMNGQEKKPKIQLVQVRQNIDYLQDFKQQRKHSSLHNNRQKSLGNEQSMKNSSILSGKGKNSIHELSTSNDFESLKVKVENLDERLRRKQMKQRHVKDIGLYGQGQQMEDEYLKAINAKLKLVQQLK